MKQLWENESCHVGQDETALIERQECTSRQHERLQARAGGDSEAVRGIPTDHEESVRQQILEGLIADKGGVSRYRRPPGFWPRLSPQTSEEFRRVGFEQPCIDERDGNFRFANGNESCHHDLGDL